MVKAIIDSRKINSLAQNSSPIPEIGRAIGGVVTHQNSSVEGFRVIASAYDSRHQRIYLSQIGSEIINGSVVWLNLSLLEVSGTTVVGETAIPAQSWALAFDPFNGYLYSPYTTNATGYPGHTVSVLNGTSFVTNITNQSVLSGPDGISCDSSNGWIYVGDGYAKGIVVINGTRIMTVIPTQTFIGGIAYDPLNGFIYATSSNDTLLVINRTTVVGTIGAGSSDFSFGPAGGDILWDSVHETIVVNSGSFVTVIAGNETSGSAVLAKIVLYSGGTVNYLGYDPANGFVYEATTDPEEMVAINGTSVVAKSVTIGSYQGGTGYPGPIVFNPVNGALYVANIDTFANNVTPVSTLLGERAPTIRPSPSADVGENTSVHSELWAVGDGQDNATVSVSPSTGFTCPSRINITITNLSADVNATCIPTLPGTYVVWLNVTDGIPNTVWGRTQVTVYSAPGITPASASRSSLDLGQSVTFSVAAFSGLAGYTYTWTGLPSGSSGALASSPAPQSRSESSW